MTSTLTPLKQPIALRTEYITSHPTTIRVKQHSNSWSGGDFTITKCPTDESPLAEKLFTVDGDFKSISQRRYFQDASGLPLFEIAHKRLGVTWFVHLPGGRENTSSPPIATIVPQWHALKDKFDVHLNNAAADGEETILEVRGQDVFKSKTHVYHKGALVTTIKLKDMVSVYIPGKRPAWELEVAEGMDMSLAAIIGVVLATVLYQSSYKGTAPKSSGSDPDPGVGSSGKELAP
ncbi:tubby C-terminal-like domain-containing protein [Aspergillus caelatus]|uniref:Tubby C-terminal-like domain-containing protein n=2 Tax=Aspergillus subgen. Circumdati TaxID=2720871 RepID=A0A5N7A710_9EURO|nr:tubby C-terminal-like domain-containing protein [Aspergillus caelatus]KAE8364899.1 tubby C-terminal-like domain-containing protein [Aspergillus caelatus]KAE8422507.1 tubby C-terminal-like domain-containing protein [Aspergillus pseudocaelatus]